MDNLKELLRLLEERLVQHDNNRAEVQSQVQEVCSGIVDEANALGEAISGKIAKDFEALEKRVFGLIDKLNSKLDSPEEEGEGKGETLNSLIKKAQEVLSKDRVYNIKHSEEGKTLSEMYKLEISDVKAKKRKGGLGNMGDDASRVEFVVGELEKHVERAQESMAAAQEKLSAICNERGSKAGKLEDYINKKMSQPFAREDARLQEVVGLIKKRIEAGTPKELEELAAKARATLAGKQGYAYTREAKVVKGRQRDIHDLVVTREVDLHFIGFAERKAPAITSVAVESGKVSLSFAFFNSDELEVVKPFGLDVDVVATVWEKGRKDDTSRTVSAPYTFGKDDRVSFGSDLAPDTVHCMTMKMERPEAGTKESDIAEFTTPGFQECCAWKECPGNVDEERKYAVDKENPRIATKISGNGDWCTITGNTPLPRSKVALWSVKILNSNDDNGYGVYVGVAPFDIDQNDGDNHSKCGWYFDCYDSTLHSGRPHKYSGKEYVQLVEEGEFVHTGDSVDVVMDTTNGELSFALNRVNLGIAYEEVPLDKPLVPCVILGKQGDSVELVI